MDVVVVEHGDEATRLAVCGLLGHGDAARLRAGLPQSEGAARSSWRPTQDRRMGPRRELGVDQISG